MSTVQTAFQKIHLTLLDRICGFISIVVSLQYFLFVTFYTARAH